MKILYCIQLTGNGHVTRANELIPEFKKVAKVDVLTSGNQNSLEIKEKVDFKLRGLSFVFGSQGGVDIFKTIFNLRPFTFVKDVLNIQVKNYDLIINDFEPVSAWACKLRGVPCYSMSRQYSLIQKNIFKKEKPKLYELLILKYFAPSLRGIGFDYKIDNSNNFYPIIKSNIKRKKIINKNHYTIYLPSFSIENIINFFSNLDEVIWHVFSPKVSKSFKKNNLCFSPTDYKVFEQSILSCEGIICNAGFETTSEALHLNKKLLIIPMKNQFEQQYNASILSDMGVTTLLDLKPKRLHIVKEWILSEKSVKVNYDYNYKLIVEKTLLDFKKISKKKPI
ncbi:MAG: glycosyltransferase family protein [Bacteroidota bacterium]|nr:glycosyltransferase family protein [Bacteroidota bacterium]